MFLALKEIRHEKLRYGLIIGMIIMISYLMFILMGMMLGLADENKAAIESWGTQTVFLNKNANDNMSQSIIMNNQLNKKLNQHEAYVGQAPAVITRVGQRHKLKESTQFIGLDTHQFIFKDQLRLIAGHRPKNEHQVVVDESLQTKGYKLGDRVRLNSSSEKYRIVGFVKNAKLNVAPVVYGSLTTWRQLRGLAPQAVASGIITNQTEKGSQFKQLEHYSAHQFINKLPGYSAQNDTFAFMIGFLMVISLVIIAVFLYILTMQKIPNYAVLRAQGIPAKHLVSATLAQAGILMVFGIIGGVFLTWVTQLVMPTTVPILMIWPLIIGLGIILVILGMLGALLPVRLILKIDPVKALNN